jgi:hypothetical protein
MFKNFLILILAVLLGISSYLLYANKNLTIDLGRDGAPVTERIVVRETSAPPQPAPAPRVKSGDLPEKGGSVVSGGDETIEIPSDEPEVHMEPTVGLNIGDEQKIVSNYKIIGPRKFALLTEKDETMVEIDLDTGLVEVNPKYELDQATTQFWKSVGRKYPEVCFVEEE